MKKTSYLRPIYLRGCFINEIDRNFIPFIIKASMNKVYVRNVDGPVFTGQKAIGFHE